MVYHITIVDRATGTVANLRRESEQTCTDTINKELGGWNNLHSAMTSGVIHSEKEYYTAGTTKDNSKAFSILALNL